MKQTIVFDFDGVIHSYVSGWQGVDIISDKPVDGIKDVIDSLRSKGYEVVIVSTRTATTEGANAIKAWLNRYDITVDNILATKPPALVYVDDRAITFDGRTDNLCEKIQNFESWLEKTR